MRKSTELPTDPTQAAHRRIPAKVARLITAKVDRVKEGAQKWADSGRDPSAIGKALEEKFLPLFESQKIIEAEAELDYLLEQLQQERKSAGALAAPTETAPQPKESAPNSLAEKFKPLMEAGQYIEAEAELDRLLAQFKPDAK